MAGEGHRPGTGHEPEHGEAVIAGELTKVHLFVLILGYSRRIYVEAFLNQKLGSWLQGTENAFRRFGGVTLTVLTDNAKALVTSHDIQSREVLYSPAFVAFSRPWGFAPRSCSPYRARTKGKVESAVGYGKHNALAGREFTSWQAMEAHLALWADHPLRREGDCPA